MCDAEAEIEVEPPSGGIRQGASNDRVGRMERPIRIQIEKLPEGLFLATSDELPGLVAQGRTVAETLEIAHDVARELIEARREREGWPDTPVQT
jgi:predicted RNase H-like HicB family nuclease